MKILRRLTRSRLSSQFKVKEDHERLKASYVEKKLVPSSRNDSAAKIGNHVDETEKSEKPDRDSGPRGRREKKVTVHSLRREFERLEREMEMGKHLGQNEKKAMKRMKEIRAKIRDMQASEDNNGELKEARGMLREAMVEQEEAHVEVQKAAQAAQEAHELMLQWNKEVDRQREQAEDAHRELRKSKKEADKAHHFYIVSLRCLHSIQDMLRAMRGASSNDGQRGARVEVQDLMSKLMSGETLSTDELMQLQRFD